MTGQTAPLNVAQDFREEDNNCKKDDFESRNTEQVGISS
jgi:hypothetical protein